LDGNIFGNEYRNCQVHGLEKEMKKKKKKEKKNPFGLCYFFPSSFTTITARPCIFSIAISFPD